MKRPSPLPLRLLLLLGGVMWLLACKECRAGGPPSAASAGFDTYIRTVEDRLGHQHAAPDNFLGGEQARAVQLTRLPTPSLDGALLHHWRASTFVPGAGAADFERVLRDVNAYPRTFAPQVIQARLLAQVGDRLQMTMRVRQRHVITVVMDTAYDVHIKRLDAQHGYSISRSTHVAEIAGAGTPGERALSGDEEHGFLWRQNTYWSYVERDGGLYLQLESVTLSRSIPHGLAWAVQPFVESVPRESLAFTLNAVCAALSKSRRNQ